MPAHVQNKYSQTLELRSIMNDHNVKCLKIYTNVLKGNRLRVKLYGISTGTVFRPADWFEKFRDAVIQYANSAGVCFMKQTAETNHRYHGELTCFHLHFSNWQKPKANKVRVGMEIPMSFEPAPGAVARANYLARFTDWQAECGKLASTLAQRADEHAKQIAVITQEADLKLERLADQVHTWEQRARISQAKARLLAFEANDFLQRADNNGHEAALILINRTNLLNAIQQVIK